MQIRNSITLIGRVGQTPEMLNTKNGTPYLRFSLATSDRYSTEEGQAVERTEWHNILVFGKRAEALGPFINKGELLVVTGTLRYQKWVDKYEQNRSSATIHLEELFFATPKGKDANPTPTAVTSLTKSSKKLALVA
ncbi:MAG: single-stranded DNA-binding protein [Lewinella sp.]|nr:single-stranded DNA-binding protein [Lewinella sp.]